MAMNGSRRHTYLRPLKLDPLNALYELLSRTVPVTLPWHGCCSVLARAPFRPNAMLKDSRERLSFRSAGRMSPLTMASAIRIAALSGAFLSLTPCGLSSRGFFIAVDQQEV